MEELREIAGIEDSGSSISAFLFRKKGGEKMDIRTERENGKLLFRWEPTGNVVSISCRDAIYDVRLIQNSKGHTYQIVDRHEKKKKKNSCKR